MNNQDLTVTEVKQMDKTENDLPYKSFASIKAGDVLIRENDHIGRPDHRLTVVEKRRGNPTTFVLRPYFRTTEYASALSSQGYNIVERNGVRVFKVFTKYW